jgi:dipeptidyl aminopeptidase/acylaminoacyl peptidase
MKRSILFIVLMTLMQSFVLGQAKKVVSPKIYDSWNRVSSTQLSRLGHYVSFEVNPEVGDGKLIVKGFDGTHQNVFPRGSEAVFSPMEDFIAFQVKAEYKKGRALKLKKKKAKDLPKDSLFIFNLKTQVLDTFPKLISKKLAVESSNWMAFLVQPEKPKKDSTEKKEVKKKPKAKASKSDPKTNTLYLMNPMSGVQQKVKNVVDYRLSRNGKIIAYSTFQRDSLPESKLFVFDTKKQKTNEIYALEGLIKNITTDNKGQNIAFLSSRDTTKQKCYSLQNYSLQTNQIRQISDAVGKQFKSGWVASPNGKIYFSRDDKHLYFGIAPKPEKEIKDSLLPEEKVHLDLWSWQDPYLQPQQLVQLKREQKRTYLCVFHFENGKLVQLADPELKNVQPLLKGNSEIALGTDNRAYRKRTSWESPAYYDVYSVNTQSGKRTLLLKEIQSRFGLSPHGKYVYWYANEDSSWYAKPIGGGVKVLLNQGVDLPLYDESHDYPQDPYPYGVAGWTENDKGFIFYDKYDLWLADPTGKAKAINLTQSFGRKNNTVLRYLELNDEAQWINSKNPLLLRAQDKTTKEAAFYSLNFKTKQIQELTKGGYRYLMPIKAKEADRIIWRRGNLNEYYNLWSSTLSFKNETKLSEANPQQKDYLWGSVELVKWNNTDGKEVEGLLYKPENFDPNKKYPMIVYFYRLHSDNLFNHYYPTPSRSVINPLHYISNGYLVFMPNIHYKIGHPGLSAYNHVVSGTLAMIAKGFVDKKNIGIQGQSWGGYETLYIVTQTDLFKAANSGAPVANMTSAYGGIRWGSGMNRAFQYEETQSRIGGSLWEKPLEYIENSPVFYAPKINTPIMFRHDDKDGAVPWYQGIEIFVALRRLNKPAWLLNYNGADHNLTKKRCNQMDFTIRMKQFFDYYLKGAPAPVWLKDGIPAIKKGKTLGLELE